MPFVFVKILIILKINKEVSIQNLIKKHSFIPLLIFLHPSNNKIKIIYEVGSKIILKNMQSSVFFYHFFLCSSMDTPPGPNETTIRSPPITESVCKSE